MGNIKQPTYLVIAKTELEKRAFTKSNLCMIRDWKMGWFEVPQSMREEFKSKFIQAGTEHSACDINITKADIKAYNLNKTQK